MRASILSAPRLRYIVLLLSSLLLVFWLHSKTILFNGLSYTSDIVNFTQSAKSIWIGQPFLWNNQFGGTSYNHNYFLIVFLGPLVLLMGSYGLFAVSLLLNLLASYALLPPATQITYQKLASSSLLIFVFLIGPIGYWVWDDPLYGWHIENLFLPLIVLLGVTTLHNSRWWCFWALLLILVREEGVLVALTTILVVDYVAGSRSLMATLWARRRTILCLSLIFIGGLLLLRAYGDLGRARMDSSFSQLALCWADKERFALLVGNFTSFLWLLSPAWISFITLRPSRAVGVILCTLPLIAVSLISTLAYFPNPAVLTAHGMTWGCRFSYIWGIYLVAITCAINKSQPTQRFSPLGLLAPMAAAAFVFQIYFLRTERSYVYEERFFSAYHTRLLPIKLLSKTERKLTRCLARVVPHSTPVIVPGLLWGNFHRHWTMSSESAEQWNLRPEILICSAHAGMPYQKPCIEYFAKLDSKHFQTVEVENMRVAWQSQWNDLIQKCLSNTRN
ncbi:MAG: hypothetical protein J0M12_05785 [Deltaproteobacteria bacterium]|nr:hypothetical protein [Deltaproteobacteria bacterium]